MKGIYHDFLKEINNAGRMLGSVLVKRGSTIYLVVAEFVEENRIGRSSHS